MAKFEVDMRDASNKPTLKQIQFVDAICEVLCLDYSVMQKTRKEVSTFIDEHLEDYQERLYYLRGKKEYTVTTGHWYDMEDEENG